MSENIGWPGTLLAGRYRLEAELGRGGMGVVFRALDILLDRPVAIKVLSSPGLGSAGRARLLGEARAAARLNHPNIVAIYDVGGGEGSEASFIVMELVEGRSLHETPLPSLADVLAVGQQICAALEHAHDHGIIHRDLKPENVVILQDAAPVGGRGYPEKAVPSPSSSRPGTDFQVKLLDFGLARSPASRLSVEGGLTGTAYYLAPEQMLGGPMDGRTDLYSLGVMLYELAAGRLPFLGDDPLTVVAQHLHAAPAAPRSLRPEIPPALEELILRLLSKTVADRPASAGEVRAALQSFTAARSFSRLQPPRFTTPPVLHLPVPLTRFIGRDRELGEVHAALLRPEVRLLTLTGPGGTGKTRLALQAASGLAGEFPDGIHFISLAPVQDAGLVLPAVAQALGVPETEDLPLDEALMDFLGGCRLLLVLDNFEQVLAGASAVGALLAAAPGLKVLATSRELLRVYGEYDYPVRPLTLPEPENLPALESLAGVDAVQLFVERARAARPGFTLTAENAAAVVEICARLDGLPLGIELAAAKARLLTPQQIRANLGTRLTLLTGGARDLPARHQTLRRAIDWSYDLLEPAESAIFRSLSAFAGSFTLEAAAAVAPPTGWVGMSTPPQDHSSASLDLLGSLIDKSLVLQVEVAGDPRFRLLETLREYAADRLAAGEVGEVEAVRRRHARYYLSLAEARQEDYVSPRLAAALDSLARETPNLRAALEWSLDRSGEDLELGLRLICALSEYWRKRGFWTEGKLWVEKALARSSEASPPVRAHLLFESRYLDLPPEHQASLLTESLVLYRGLGDRQGTARALAALGYAAFKQNRPDQARARLQESQEIATEIQDGWCLMNIDLLLGKVAMLEGDMDRAAGHFERGLSRARELDSPADMAEMISLLGVLALERMDPDGAQALFERSLAIMNEVGDRQGIANLLNRLGELARLQGDLERAGALYDQSLEIARELESSHLIAMVAHNRGYVTLRQGDPQAAARLFREALTLLGKSDHWQGVALCLAGIAGAAAAVGRFERAARLFGAAAAHLYQPPIPVAKVDQDEWDVNLQAARAGLSEPAFAAAFAAGQALNRQVAIAAALDEAE